MGCSGLGKPGLMKESWALGSFTNGHARPEAPNISSEHNNVLDLKTILTPEYKKEAAKIEINQLN